jgi:hypothetical protein
LCNGKTLAFQAKDAGSIPAARSNFLSYTCLPFNVNSSNQGLCGKDVKMVRHRMACFGRFSGQSASEPLTLVDEGKAHTVHQGRISSVAVWGTAFFPRKDIDQSRGIRCSTGQR